MNFELRNNCHREVLEIKKMSNVLVKRTSALNTIELIRIKNIQKLANRLLKQWKENTHEDNSL